MGEGYERSMAGADLKYWSRLKLWFRCPDCAEDLEAGSLAAHRQTGHGVGMRAQWDTPSPPPMGEPYKYQVSFLYTTGMWYCQVEGCQGRAATRAGLRVKILHCHLQYTVVITEEGKLSHPRCHLCYILVPWMALNGLHPNTAHLTKRS